MQLLQFICGKRDSIATRLHSVTLPTPPECSPRQDYILAANPKMHVSDYE